MINAQHSLYCLTFGEFSSKQLVDRPRPRPPRSLFSPETEWYVVADDVAVGCAAAAIDVVAVDGVAVGFADVAVAGDLTD